jgi:hypothetical protein
MKRKQISIRMPVNLIEDLKLLAGAGGSYQSLAITLLDQAVNKEISQSVKRIQAENEIMRARLKAITAEVKELNQ